MRKYVKLLFQKLGSIFHRETKQVGNDADSQPKDAVVNPIKYIHKKNKGEFYLSLNWLTNQLFNNTENSYSINKLSKRVYYHRNADQRVNHFHVSCINM